MAPASRAGAAFESSWIQPLPIIRCRARAPSRLAPHVNEAAAAGQSYDQAGAGGPGPALRPRVTSAGLEHTSPPSVFAQFL